MAARIQLLPAALADQIAAGEVVERPASVVKELVENALDAGARRIEIEIEGGGLARILVTDDGDGMTPEEAHLALRRHATSKLRAVEDLFRLSTFGFRGEALPSIASISELILTTKTPDATAGYEVHVRSGEQQSAREVGAPPGTRIEILGLFANVPGRLKFQKAAGTETGHVTEAIVRAALSAPEVAFFARVDGRMTIELPTHRSLADRATAILRRTAGRGLRVAIGTGREGEVDVEAHLAPPDEALQSARRVHLLVNRRVVRDRGLLTAIQLGFGALLPRGRHPLAVVAVTMPQADVDVNVHPQKIEVRLARAAEVYAVVRHTIARALSDAGFVALAPGEADAKRYAADSSEPLWANEEADDELYALERGRAFEAIRALDDGSVVTVPPKPSNAPIFLGALPSGYLAFREASGVVVIDQHVASALCIAAGPPPNSATHAEIDAARTEGGPEEARERAITLAAISPAAVIDRERAEALFAELRGLESEARVPPLAEARWRGRRVLVRIPLSELWRRFEA